MHLRFASLVICTTAVTFIACSSTPTDPVAADSATGEDTSVSEDTSTPPEDSGSPEDSGGGVDSTTPTDTGTPGETSVMDAPDTRDVSLKCSSPGSTEEEDCGKCGKRSRLCNSDGTWLPWGLCGSETGSCVPGETRMITCGKCGKRSESCTSTCDWDPMACTGEGLCNAGDMEIQYGACSNPTYVKTRTCSTTACTWGDWSGCVPPKGWVDIATTSLAGRYNHTAVWTGTDMIVWGGYSGSYYADGAAYALSSNSWRTLPTPSAPTARYWHTAVWTGTEMLVWGGYGSTYPYSLNTGGAYDPSLDRWSSLPATSLTARHGHSAVWTGTEMIIWGGYTYFPSTYNADGAAYNPTTKTWRTIAAAPLPGRYQHTALYANGKMIVFGGRATSSSYSGLGDAAAYDPVANTWTVLTPPSADLDARYEAMGAVDPTKKMVGFFGGYGPYVGSSYMRGTGAIYDTNTSTWKSIGAALESILPYSRRHEGTAWWAPDGFYVWGGQAQNTSGSSLYQYASTGAVFDPATGNWRAMSDSNALSPRYLPTSVWTGAEAIVWGGVSYNSPTYRNDGKIYRP